MGLLSWLRPKGFRIPLTRTEAMAAGRRFAFLRVWQCPCGAQLKIRAREDRADGPSNYRGVYTWPMVRDLHLPAGFVGHTVTPDKDLNWNGLAEERGWQPDPVRCPACLRGLTIPQYRAMQRAGKVS